MAGIGALAHAERPGVRAGSATHCGQEQGQGDLAHRASQPAAIRLVSRSGSWAAPDPDVGRGAAWVDDANAAARAIAAPAYRYGPFMTPMRRFDDSQAST